jgi:hypothetical protein
MRDRTETARGLILRNVLEEAPKLFPPIRMAVIVTYHQPIKQQIKLSS